MIAIIAAFSENRVLGMNGRIPWRIPGEQKRFRTLTSGHTIVMGRRTYEEISRPLPNRRNIVISSSQRFEGVETVSSLKQALALAQDDDIYLSGGAKVYEEGLTYADTLYLTRIHAEIEGDAFFPEFDENAYELVEEEDRPDAEIPYTYQTWKRK